MNTFDSLTWFCLVVVIFLYTALNGKISFATDIIKTLLNTSSGLRSNYGKRNILVVLSVYLLSLIYQSLLKTDLTNVREDLQLNPNILEAGYRFQVSQPRTKTSNILLERYYEGRSKLQKHYLVELIGDRKLSNSVVFDPTPDTIKWENVYFMLDYSIRNKYVYIINTSPGYSSVMPIITGKSATYFAPLSNLTMSNIYCRSIKLPELLFSSARNSYVSIGHFSDKLMKIITKWKESGIFTRFNLLTRQQIMYRDRVNIAKGLYRDTFKAINSILKTMCIAQYVCLIVTCLLFTIEKNINLKHLNLANLKMIWSICWFLVSLFLKQVTNIAKLIAHLLIRKTIQNLVKAFKVSFQ